jgi:hypothetical protein
MLIRAIWLIPIVGLLLIASPKKTSGVASVRPQHIRTGDKLLLQRTPEKSDALRLSILLDRAIFKPQGEAKASINIENKTGGIVDLRLLRLFLSKYKEEQTDYHTYELFGSNFSLSSKKLKKGEKFEFDVNPTKLNWSDMLSSWIDIKNNPNMFEIIPAGDYYLYVEAEIPMSSPAKTDENNISVKSNVILVNVSQK